MEKQLNVVFIGSPAFPNGFAMTKRRRYLVDYMNAHGIQSHVLVCHHKKNKLYDNPEEGEYGLCTYCDITQFAVKRKFIAFYRRGKAKLKEWYVEHEQNVLVFSSTLPPLQLPFYRYARKLGYKIVFDQVETSMIAIGGKISLKRRINEWISDRLTLMAFAKSNNIVISTALLNQTKEQFPNNKFLLLPNSTPSLKKKDKLNLHIPLRVLYSGTFASKDGVEYLIDGAKKAVMKGCNLELILMGKGQARDMKVLEKLKDCNWAKYLGFVSDEELLNQIQNADVLCMTRNNSLFANYGFPFKLSEYLATGNILLATRVGDVTKYVKDKESAYLVEPENSEQIANALCYIQCHEEEAIVIANNGYKAMLKHFYTESVGEKFVSFLKTI